MGLFVEDGAADLADLAGAEFLDEQEGAARVCHVVDDQDARVFEIDELRDRRQYHRHLESLVDAGVELDVHRERVLHVECVAERARDEQASPRDPEHHVGDVPVGVDRFGELARAGSELLPGHHLSHSRPTISSGRTGTRESSRPVASRNAATIAAVETTVGGSPTPFTPYRASGSGGSTGAEA